MSWTKATAAWAIFLGVSALAVPAVGQATNPQQNPAANPQDAGAQAALQQAPQPQMPAGFPLDAETQSYIEQLLAYWESYSSQVTHYQSAFTRWQFDMETCNYRNPANNHLVAAVISRGSIRYRQPDRGMYEVTEKWQFAGPPEAPGGEPQYDRRSLTNENVVEEEKWICDGTSIFEYDFEMKRLTEIVLPPEAQGEGLKNSPLPFVFGAKATELLDRYWIRDVTPADAQDQYWLEAFPKRASDAQSYSKLEIILTREPFLPVAIHMYAPNYDAKTNPSKMVFEFRDREINGTLAGLLDRFFIRPSTPLGWEFVQQDLAQETGASLMNRVGQDEQGGAIIK